MNTLEMTPEVRQRVLDEAKTAFLLNIQVRVWAVLQGHPCLQLLFQGGGQGGQGSYLRAEAWSLGFQFCHLPGGVILGKSLS